MNLPQEVAEDRSLDVLNIVKGTLRTSRLPWGR
jgi:hypothetical protein